MKGIDRWGIKEIMLTMYLCYIYGTFIVYIYYIIFICNKEVKNLFMKIILFIVRNYYYNGK